MGVEHNHNRTQQYHPGHDDLHAFLIIFVLFSIFFVQVGLLYWKKKSIFII